MRGRNVEVNKRTRRLRRQATDAEMKLWFTLRDRRLDGFKFSRQTPIGRYIADFVCRERMLIVEVDGGQHADNASDQIRDKFLEEEGYRVLRFWNNDVLQNPDGVLAVITEALRNPH